MSPEKRNAWRQYAAASLGGFLVHNREIMYGDTKDAEKVCQAAATMANAMLDKEIEFLGDFALEKTR